jgi:hypothetical protein
MHPLLEVTRQSASEYLGWEIPSSLTAQWTGVNDPRIRHRLDGCGDVLTASFALDYEVVESGGGSVEG